MGLPVRLLVGREWGRRGFSVLARYACRVRFRTRGRGPPNEPQNDDAGRDEQADPDQSHADPSSKGARTAPPKGHPGDANSGTLGRTGSGEQDRSAPRCDEEREGWLARCAARTSRHDLHLVGLNERDRPFVAPELLAASGLALTRDAWKERIAQLEASGVTEIAYQPAGPDIPRELEAFASAAR